MPRYRLINNRLDRDYRNDLNANFEQIEADILGITNLAQEDKTAFLAELKRIEKESKERDDLLAGTSLETLLKSIDAAKQAAYDAAASVNSKGDYAQEKGDYAQEKGDYAKDQGDYAKIKGDYADEKAQSAVTAAGRAETEASNLSTLKADVSTATQTANEAAIAANDKATLAQSNADIAKREADIAKIQAAYAKAQGDYAKAQGESIDEIKAGTGFIPTTDKGKANGVAPLNESRIVPNEHLPAFETAEGAQAKANTAEKNAKDASIPLSQKGKANGVAGLNEAGNVIDAQGNEVKGAVSSVNSKTGDVALSKDDIGLSNVTNDRQATKAEFDAHNNDDTKHITDAERTKWNNGATVPNASTTQKGIVMLSDSSENASITVAATANAVKRVNDKFSDNALSLGNGSSATTFSSAFGYAAKASSIYSDAFGFSAQASAANSIAVGMRAYAGGDGSMAIGRNASTINKDEGVLGAATSLDGTKSWKVPGSFSVAGTKQFEIPHPSPRKRYTHVIRHGAVESPTTGDTLYRYYVDIKGDTADVKMVGSDDIRVLPTNRLEDGIRISIPLPDYWVWLNINDQVFVSPDRHFSNGYGFVDRDKETLELTFRETRKYNVILFGTRNDDHESIQTWHVKGVEREVGESWLGETYVFEDDEIIYENEYLEEEII